MERERSHDRASGPVAAASGTTGSFRSAGAGDALSDVLEAVRLTGALFFTVEAAPPWIAEAPDSSALAPVILTGGRHVVSYHIMVRGSCWCRMAGMPAVPLEAGDVLVVPHGDAYALSSAPDLDNLAPVDPVLDWFRQMASGELPSVVTEGGDGPPTLHVVCGFLGCDDVPFNPVLAALPRLLRLRPSADRPDALDQLIELIVGESRHRRAGGRSVLVRIGELLFVEVVRMHLAAATAEDGGWLAGLRDPMVGRVLARMHGEPQRAWTLDDLARDAGTSRSVLAERFTHFVGETPMRYLAKWRLQRAAGLLMEGTAKVAAVALAVGYESEAAFSRAFKKHTGVAPSAWRHR
jgi:AraC-like DNA-binding protein